MEEFDRRDVRSRIGMTLSNTWRLDALLGAGGMAAVYRATHRDGGQAAVKMLHPGMAADPEACARFLREGLVANAVNHPNTVRVFGQGKTETGQVFLVLELLEGASLDEIAGRRGGTIDVRSLLAIGMEICDVLAAAHGIGVVHRDIKPDNVFLTREGRVKVLDFGIARAAFMQGQLTQTGVPIGTPSFMAPEQALGEHKSVDARTDIYAVGATLYTLASGRDVHEAMTLAEVFLKAAREPAPSLRSVLPRAPPAFITLVDRALSQSKEQRFASAMDVRSALNQANQLIFGRPLATPADLAQLLNADPPKLDRTMDDAPASIEPQTVPKPPTDRPPLQDVTVFGEPLGIGVPIAPPIPFVVDARGVAANQGNFRPPSAPLDRTQKEASLTAEKSTESDNSNVVSIVIGIIVFLLVIVATVGIVKGF